MRSAPRADHRRRNSAPATHAPCPPAHTKHTHSATPHAHVHIGISAYPPFPHFVENFPATKNTEARNSKTILKIHQALPRKKGAAERDVGKNVRARRALILLQCCVVYSTDRGSKRGEAPLETRAQGHLQILRCFRPPNASPLQPQRRRADGPRAGQGAHQSGDGRPEGGL